jgi:hypothetical protein
LTNFTSTVAELSPSLFATKIVLTLKTLLLLAAFATKRLFALEALTAAVFAVIVATPTIFGADM